MTDRSRIGHTTAPTTHAVDAWRVRLFCRAIGNVLVLRATLTQVDGDASYDLAVQTSSAALVVRGSARVAVVALVGAVG